jgi:uncharacterized protein YbjT (DUF2867 family)
VKLVVFGANGPTGRLLTRRALDEGHAVTAVTRRPDAFPITAPQLRVVGADALDPKAVADAVAGQDRVISTLGVPYTKEPVTTFSHGTRIIAEAMRRHGLRRLVCVSSIGVHTDIPPQMALLYRRIVGPILLSMGRSVYDDVRRMEQIVAATDLDWTIVRPSGLFDTAAVSDYTVLTAPDRVTGMFTSRADLADLLLREAVDDGHLRARVEVLTTRGTPNYLKVFLKEALHIGR